MHCQHERVRGLHAMLPTHLMPSPMTPTCLAHAPATGQRGPCHFTLTSSPRAAALLPYTAQVNVTVLQKSAPISLPLWNLPRFSEASWMALSIVLCSTFFMPDSHKPLPSCITVLFTCPCLLLEWDVVNGRDKALFTHQSLWHLLKYLDLRK